MTFTVPHNRIYDIYPTHFGQKRSAGVLWTRHFCKSKSICHMICHTVWHDPCHMNPSKGWCQHGFEHIFQLSVEKQPMPKITFGDNPSPDLNYRQVINYVRFSAGTPPQLWKQLIQNFQKFANWNIFLSFTCKIIKNQL